MKYYVYRHVRVDKNEVFYIGIGTKQSVIRGYSDEYKRALDKKKRNIFWNRIIELTEYIVEIIYESNDISEIYNKEIEFISLYKRVRDGGSLCNLTLGGETMTGYKHSDVFRKKCSDRAKLNNPNKGKSLSKIHRDRISESHKGLKVSAIGVEKMKLRGKKIFCVETGIIYSNGTDTARRLFDSENRYMRMAICRSIRNKEKFKNYTFQWAVS